MRRGGKGLRQRVPREQIESRFGKILGELVDRVPGARAAALVDNEGETVDYAGNIDAFAVRVTAAHMRIVLQQAVEQSVALATANRNAVALATANKNAVAAATAEPCASVWVRTSRSALAVHALPEGYAIVLLLSHKAHFAGNVRAISATAQLLAEEVGWARSQLPRWYSVDVASDFLGRPQSLRIRGIYEPLDAIGRFQAGLRWCERGWRVRFSSGVEAMLVRERGGFWYADEFPKPEKRAPKNEDDNEADKQKRLTDEGP